MNNSKISIFHEISNERSDEFFNKEYARRYFFPHKIYYIPKPGPDGFLLAHRELGAKADDRFWEILLFADSQCISEFPDDLFFDDDIIWHQQQFGKSGHIAAANLVVKDQKLYAYLYISDLVQRISRKREYRTRIENRFKGWNVMLLNAVMNFAREHKFDTVHSITSAMALQNTDQSRDVKKELFERIYDRAVHKIYRAGKIDRWWTIGVEENRSKIVIPEKKSENIVQQKTICLCHDVERGFGHVDVDPKFAKEVDVLSQAHLDEMLNVEKQMSIKATYHVLGNFIEDEREKIESDGHCTGFHSYDHNIHKDSVLTGIPGKVRFFFQQKQKRKIFHPYYSEQLENCRELDYRIKGYRPPRSKITRDLSDANLRYYNFEWLASAINSIGLNVPAMINGIVKIPVMFDDFDMYKENMAYELWEDQALEMIRNNAFVAFCLHDCYARYWLPRYREFLEKVCGLGQLKTLNGVAAEIIWMNAQ